MTKMKRKNFGPKKRFEILESTNFRCVYCGRKPPEVKLVLDHVKPIRRNGEDATNNLAPACEECNSGKGARMLGSKFFVCIKLKDGKSCLYVTDRSNVADFGESKVSAIPDAEGFMYAPVDKEFFDILTEYEDLGFIKPKTELGIYSKDDKWLLVITSETLINGSRSFSTIELPIKKFKDPFPD